MTMIRDLIGNVNIGDLGVFKEGTAQLKLITFQIFIT